MRTKIFIMSERIGRNTFYVAMFAIFSLGVLVVGGGYLCGYDMLNTTSCYRVILDDCQNLSIGNAVFLRGYKVGTVRDIRFDKEKLNFEIIFCVEKDIKVTVDSTVSVCSSLFGDKTLDLFIGSGKNATPGSLLEVSNKTGSLKTNMEAVVATTKVVLSNLNTILENLNKNNTINNTQELLVSLKKTIENVDNFVTDFKKNPKKFLKLF